MLNILQTIIGILIFPIRFILEIIIGIIGVLSLVISFFQIKPSLTIPQIIQIFFPYSLFGRISWWLFFKILQYNKKHHVHLMAGTGAGKSFFMLQMVYRDIVNGHGVLIIEPHSQMIEHVLHLKVLQLNHSKKYFEKILLLDFESSNPPAFNIFSIPFPQNLEQREIQIHSIVQNYMEAFGKAFEIPQGARRILKNTLIILFDLPHATILDLLHILKRSKYFPPKYQSLINHIQNPVLKKFFEEDFFSSKSELSKEALRTRIEHLLIDRQIQLSMTQKGNVFNAQEVLRNGNIVLVKAGVTIGQETSWFIGALLHQLILYGGFLRVQQKYKRRFSIYLDECQNYMSDDISKGLDEARKSNIEYILAHQRLKQRGTSKDQQHALNACAVKMYGRLEYRDAWKLSKQLLMKGQEERFLNLRSGEFFIKMGFLKTRFLKLPKAFAPNPETIGKIRHRIFALSKDVSRLKNYLKSKIPKKLSSTPLTNPKHKQALNSNSHEKF